MEHASHPHSYELSSSTRPPHLVTAYDTVVPPADPPSARAASSINRVPPQPTRTSKIGGPAVVTEGDGRRANTPVSSPMKHYSPTPLPFHSFHHTTTMAGPVEHVTVPGSE